MDKNEFKQKLATVQPKSADEADRILDKMLDNTPYIACDRVLIFALEESAEFQQAITKYIRGVHNNDISNIIEEISDFMVVLAGIQKLLNIPDETFEKAGAIKMDRMVERIEKDGVLL